ncbi:MAG: 4Fe-4S dicluster domain-containing protein [Ruminococcaceae bacterium]|nr:4Fe-4S dicluster domain-containing protein [Oscillospiraceae bacterium]
MISIENKLNCCGCSACSNICPKNAIKMVPDSEGFLYPEIDIKNCIDCGLCEKICPVNINRPEGEYKTYGAFNLNTDERLKSSSGGIFALLAKKVLEDKGIVFGASFDENLNLSHNFTDNEYDLEKLMGSKYLQSNTEKSYKEVENKLKDGIKVLYSGTPCQIAGIKSYLKKEYDNLYLVDIICHGAPSPLAFKEYIKYLEKKYKSKVKSYNFRAKPNGWRSYQNLITFDNEKKIYENINENLFMRAFLKNVILRPSCHSCAFKTVPKDSDITLGDFWGISKASDYKDDDKGLSLIVVNTQKGNNLLQSIKENVYLFETDNNSSLKFNSSAVKSSVAHPKRDEFLKDLTSDNFKKKVYKYLNLGFKGELKLKIKSILKKLSK